MFELFHIQYWDQITEERNLVDFLFELTTIFSKLKLTSPLLQGNRNSLLSVLHIYFANNQLMTGWDLQHMWEGSTGQLKTAASFSADCLALFPKPTIQINRKDWWGTCPLQRQTEWKAQSHAGIRFPSEPQMRKTGLAAKAVGCLQFGRVMSDRTFPCSISAPALTSLPCCPASTRQTWKKSGSRSQVKCPRLSCLRIWKQSMGDRRHPTLSVLEHHKHSRHVGIIHASICVAQAGFQQYEWETWRL